MPISYRTALLNGRLMFNGARPDIPGPDRGDRVAVGHPTALEFEDDGCTTLATDGGFESSRASLYRVCSGILRSLLSFEKTEQVIPESDGDYHWRWTPNHILTIDDRTMVIGGEYGGMYLLTQTSDTAWSMRSLDERLGQPVFF